MRVTEHILTNSMDTRLCNTNNTYIHMNVLKNTHVHLCIFHCLCIYFAFPFMCIENRLLVCDMFDIYIYVKQYSVYLCIQICDMCYIHVHMYTFAYVYT